MHIKRYRFFTLTRFSKFFYFSILNSKVRVCHTIFLRWPFLHFFTEILLTFALRFTGKWVLKIVKPNALSIGSEPKSYSFNNLLGVSITSLLAFDFTNIQQYEKPCDCCPTTFSHNRIKSFHSIRNINSSFNQIVEDNNLGFGIVPCGFIDPNINVKCWQFQDF